MRKLALAVTAVVIAVVGATVAPHAGDTVQAFKSRIDWD